MLIVMLLKIASPYSSSFAIFVGPCWIPISSISFQSGPSREIRKDRAARMRQRAAYMTTEQTPRITRPTIVINGMYCPFEADSFVVVVVMVVARSARHEGVVVVVVVLLLCGDFLRGVL